MKLIMFSLAMGLLAFSANAQAEMVSGCDILVHTEKPLSMDSKKMCVLLSGDAKSNSASIGRMAYHGTLAYMRGKVQDCYNVSRFTAEGTRWHFEGPAFKEAVIDFEGELKLTVSDSQGTKSIHLKAIAKDSDLEKKLLKRLAETNKCDEQAD